MAVLEIQNLSSSVKKYFTRECSERVKYFFNTRREIRPCNVLFII